MPPTAYGNCEWDEVVLMERPCAMTEDWLDWSTAPAGVHLYGVRHSDSDWGRPVEVLDRPAIVNHFGTIASATPLDDLLDAEGWLDLEDEDDLCYTGGGLIDPPTPAASAPEGA